jgi:hypothetical protein
MEYLWVGLGGFLGANARYALGVWIVDRLGAAFPLHTLIINLSGDLDHMLDLEFEIEDRFGGVAVLATVPSAPGNLRVEPMGHSPAAWPPLRSSLRVLGAHLPTASSSRPPARSGAE